MAIFKSSSLHITKRGADIYHCVLKSDFRLIDEIVDSPKLLAMLKRESLQNANAEPVSAEDVVSAADFAEINHRVDLTVVERVA